MPQPEAPPPEASVENVPVHPVDITAIRDVFTNLERSIQASPRGAALLEQFKDNPLQVLKERGVNLVSLGADPDVWNALQNLLRSSEKATHPEAAPEPPAPPESEEEALKLAPTPEAGAAPGEEDEWVPSQGAASGFGCWACVKSAATAISIVIAGAASVLRKGGAHVTVAIPAVAPALAPILGVSTPVAAERIAQTLVETDDLEAFIDRLAHEACKAACA